MPPDTQNPLVIAAYVTGLLLSLPVLYALIRLIVFFASLSAEIKAVAKGLSDLVSEMQQYRELDVRVVRIEERHAEEDRRTGPPDRRTA